METIKSGATETPVTKMTELQKEPLPIPTRVVISGGQTGVDRAGLDAARAANIRIGGWVPAGRRSEDGEVPFTYFETDPERIRTYGTLQATHDPGYTSRTALNCSTAKCTIILDRVPRQKYTSGTALTYKLARKYGHVLCVNLDSVDDDTIEPIREWLREVNAVTVNIAGPRESKCPGIYKEALLVLTAVFTGKLPPEDD